MRTAIRSAVRCRGHLGRVSSGRNRRAVSRLGFYGAAQRASPMRHCNCSRCLIVLSGLARPVVDADQMVLQIHESSAIRSNSTASSATNATMPAPPSSTRRCSARTDTAPSCSPSPTIHCRRATYAFDDDGTPAPRHELIRDGILERPGRRAVAAACALPGVAIRAHRTGTARRSTAWPISISNRATSARGDDRRDRARHPDAHQTSWSIDDHRNKFQFGCEFGQLIENGKLTQVVKQPNYRGISANFWRSLSAVGDASTRQVFGTPMCGKGEPAQVIRVGHASPACVFSNIDVFGGA